MSSPSPAGSRRSRSSDDEGAQIAVSFHCHSSRLRVIGSLQPVICAGLVFKLLFSSTIIFLTLLQENQRRRRQQRRGLGASTVSERSAEDANLLSVPNLPRRNVTHGVMSERYHLGGRVETDTVAMAAARQDRAGIQRRHRLERRLGDDPSQTPPFTSLVARHEVSQDTEEPPLQLSINPALPNQPRPSLPRPSLAHDPIDPPQSRRGRGRPRLHDDPIDPVPSRLVCPMIPSIVPRLGLDVLVCPPMIPSILSILHRLGLDVLVYLMHRYRITLPQVTLCPRHTGLGSKVSGRLYTTRQKNIALNAMKDGLTYS